MAKGLLFLALAAGTGAAIYFGTKGSGEKELTTEQKRDAMAALTKNDNSPQAGKPFYKMSADEVDTCYKFMYYYQDIANNGKNKKEMPTDFKAKIAAISQKWNIFT